MKLKQPEQQKTLHDIFKGIKKLGIDFVEINDLDEGTKERLDINESLAQKKPIISPKQ